MKKILGAWCLILGLLLNLSAEDWQRAIGPYPWAFPRDHGAHPDFRSEWWYFTGNLQDEHGRSFGYQFTIFRQGVFREPAQKLSQWALRDVFFGHFTVSDLDRNHFYYDEKVDRGALGLAGAATDRLSVQLRDWRIEPLSGSTREAYRLQAEVPGRSIDFVVTPAQPLVLEGDHGLSQKAAGVGNASYYYSYPRMETKGVLALGDHPYTVQGTTWFDHEFSTSSLGSDQVGWDWFCLQLDSGEELMIYGLRKSDGTWDVTSRGVWISPQSQTTDLLHEEFSVETLAFWPSPKSGGHYPSKWRIRIPRLQVDLVVTPRMADQELRLHELSEMAYWEGACLVVGSKGLNKITGVGYTELTGYATPLGQGLK